VWQSDVVPPTGSDCLLAVRSIATVRRQFALRDDPWPVNHDAPVAVMRSRRPSVRVFAWRANRASSRSRTPCSARSTGSWR
jgi:hypothetical protein